MSREAGGPPTSHIRVNTGLCQTPASLWIWHFGLCQAEGARARPPVTTRALSLGSPAAAGPALLSEGLAGSRPFPSCALSPGQSPPGPGLHATRSDCLQCSTRNYIFRTNRHSY